MAAIRIGISGWRYKPWRGTFYPKDLPQHAELEYAASILAVIEINGSFYSLQRPSSYARWYADTPNGFTFAVKGPRFITHMLRLKSVEVPLANFFASGLFNLREKLGPILWQFPPNFRYDHDRLAGFLDLLPRDTKAALALARRRNAIVKGRSRLAIDARRSLRHAIEIRHESFLDPRFVDLLREHNTALVIAETARRWPMVQDITADSSTSGCTATRSCTRAATPTGRWTSGQGASPPGTEAPSRRTRGRSHPGSHRRGNRAMSTASSTIPTSSCAPRSMRKR